jgi:hypothetical protein
MKIKTLRNVMLGFGCLMLTLTLSTGILNNNVKNTNANSSSYTIHLDQDMPNS